MLRKIEKSEFPDDVRSKIRRGSVIMTIVAIALIIAVIAIIAATQ